PACQRKCVAKPRVLGCAREAARDVRQREFSSAARLGKGHMGSGPILTQGLRGILRVAQNDTSASAGCWPAKPKACCPPGFRWPTARATLYLVPVICAHLRHLRTSAPAPAGPAL